MDHKRTALLTGAFLGALLFGLIFVLAVFALPAEATVLCSGAEQQGGDAPAGEVVTSVWIKAGDSCFGPYTSDGTYEDACTETEGEPPCDTEPNACYAVSGIGTGSASGEKVGDGQAQVCQTISHIEIASDPVPTTPDPTATDVPPTATPTEPECQEDCVTPTATTEPPTATSVPPTDQPPSHPPTGPEDGPISWVVYAAAGGAALLIGSLLKLSARRRSA